jgi:hypothetical protein
MNRLSGPQRNNTCGADLFRWSALSIGLERRTPRRPTRSSLKFGGGKEEDWATTLPDERDVSALRDCFINHIGGVQPASIATPADSKANKRSATTLEQPHTLLFLRKPQIVKS